MRNRRSNKFSYIYLEREEDQFCVIPLRNDFFSDVCEMEYFDFNECETLKNLKQGFYRIEFETYTDHEYCDGFKISSYDVLGDVTRASWSLKAAFIFNTLFILDYFFAFIDLFRPVWKIDIEYGGVGITAKKMFLPRALFHRYIYPKPILSWGPGYTDLRIRK